MTIYIESDEQIAQEAWEILLSHMSPSRLARFWAAQRQGRGDYLLWRDKTFAESSVAELYAAVEAHQAAEGDE